MKAYLHPRFLHFVVLTAALLLSIFITPAGVLDNDDPIGIQFFTGSWKKLLAEAKKQNKPVFVDIYTTWCGPCKLMAKEAFPDKRVGNLFNASFINYQLNAEKGEGIDIAKKYDITGYPTSLFVSADGNLIQRIAGYGGINWFLNEATKAIEAAKDPKTIAVWDNEFESGNRDASFLKAYLTKRAKVGMPNTEALETYLTVVSESEWTTRDNIDILIGNLTTSKSKAFDALIKAAQDMYRIGGQMERIETIIHVTQDVLFDDERSAKTETDLDQIISTRQTMNTMLSIQAASEIDQNLEVIDVYMAFYKRTRNVAKYRRLAKQEANSLMAIPLDSLRAIGAAEYQRYMELIKSWPDSSRNSPNTAKYAASLKAAGFEYVANKLNTLAGAYFELMTNSADLNTALAWSGRSLELDRSPMFLDTHAQLLNKVGRKAEAIKYEEEALAKAKAAGEDTADYAKTLASFRR